MATEISAERTIGRADDIRMGKAVLVRMRSLVREMDEAAAWVSEASENTALRYYTYGITSGRDKVLEGVKSLEERLEHLSTVVRIMAECPPLWYWQERGSYDQGGAETVKHLLRQDEAGPAMCGIEAPAMTRAYHPHDAWRTCKRCWAKLGASEREALEVARKRYGSGTGYKRSAYGSHVLVAGEVY